ncbi:MAG: DUF1404 domain-containing protein [Candidatus Aramenus sp.]|jgi:hypothetical protein|nr:DUF1404 domain-containing protein [Candidatus Aramenus sp.]
MKIEKTHVKTSWYVTSLALLLAFLNPVTESLETVNQWLFMLSHYFLFVGGFLLSYKVVRGPSVWIVPSAFLAVLWHLPYFFALAGAFLTFRAMNDASMIASGVLAGIGAGSLSVMKKLGLLIVWMTADTVYSIVFLLQFPQYSNSAYPFSPFPISQEVNTAIAMWVVMSGVIVYVLGGFLKELLL